MDDLPQFKDLGQLIGSATALFVQLECATAGLEARHKQIILLTKVRVETRLKNKAAQEVTVFALFLGRLNRILQEAMPPDAYRALQKRFERDLSEISRRTLECHTVSVCDGNVKQE